jgi:hypothetical protein
LSIASSMPPKNISGFHNHPFHKTAMERKISNRIKQKGPLTGAELHGLLGGDPYLLWKSCMHAPRMSVRSVGQRFLRLDQKVSGFARLSPSIMREFLTYSVIGLNSDTDGLEQRGQELLAHIHEVSESKRDLAQSIVAALTGQFAQRGIGDKDLCVFIAGDIVYDMAHDVPRPERSTGKMIRGSDLDLVFILNDRVPDEVMQELDEAVYQEKYRYLINPSMREEIDYIVKKLDRVREQAAFDTFKRMIACKILHEGILLYGSDTLFQAAKSMLAEYGVNEKLARMQQEAETFRAKAEEYLLGGHPDGIADEDRYLFYTAEESEEFE